MFKLLQRIVAILRILLPIFTVSAFWLGAEELTPVSHPGQYLFSALVMTCAMATPLLVISYWRKRERILLMSEAIANNTVYGTQVLPFRASLTALFGTLFVTGVIKALGHGLFFYRYLVLPIGFAAGTLLLVLLAFLADSYVRVRNYDGLVTVCRGYQGEPAETPIYEAWPPREAMEKFTYLNGDGRALTEEEALMEILGLRNAPPPLD